MTYKSIPLFLFSLSTMFFMQASAQSAATSVKPVEETFYSITRNKAWIINQYYLTSKQTDKKSSFKGCTFRFNQDDTSKFLVENVSTNSMVGSWNAQDNNKVIFSLPLITRDSSSVWTASDATSSSPSEYKTATAKNSPADSAYNEVAKLLSGGTMQIVERASTKLKLRLQDALQGEVFIEFLKKD